uniref:NADH dehydrogenase subunit 6 n=1 Tax=Ampithoe lacertosa TaxID=429030 RepID=A0A5P9W8I6_9CRUS|nr:NADH dehydrogenase subunit 6 [Ampithoe lacertosa]QFX74905.1 NADH dehydrogenase subunit 6 [Ampithoe lacertosa]
MLYIMTTIFIISNHPLMMGFTLMTSSVIYAVMLYLLNSSSWLMYILIMIFVSGVMVMFIYMASLSSNEPMTFSLSLFLKMTLMFMLPMLFFILTKQLKTNYLVSPLMNQFFKPQSMELIYKTYNKIMLETTVMLTVYLFIVLVVAVKIVNNFKVPLRSNK